MKLSHTLLIPFAFLGSSALLLSTAGCDRSSANAVGTTAPVTAPAVPAAKPKPEPTATRLTHRIGEMWEHKAKAEWVETYDYLSPEMRKTLLISMYLQNKESHEYQNPVIHEVMRIENNLGYVRLSVTWTPHHPQLAKVKLEPGQSLTQDLEIIETWSWVDGEWYQARAPQSPEDFFEEHPDFLKASEPK